MDVCDRAAACQERFNLEAIERHRRRLGAGAQILRWCRSCGNEIPQNRRDAARMIGMPCELCIECQTAFEELSR